MYVLCVYVCMYCVCMYVCMYVLCMYVCNVCMYMHIYTPHTYISPCLGPDAPDLVRGNATAGCAIRNQLSSARPYSNQGLYVSEPSTFEVGGVGAPLQ